MSRNLHLWLPGWLRREWRRGRSAPAPRHVYVCVADHYEPFWGGADTALAHARVQQWQERYPEAAARHRDSDGRSPRHSFFYPADEYDAGVVDRLAGLCRQGHGEVEVHLHHDNDTARGLRATLNEYRHTLFERHGLLRREPRTGEIVYAFIHGNWALDNSRPDGRWCGVDNEIAVLLETGCRVDMTMPSAPSDTQTRKVNSIYFARGREGCRKSHDGGRDARLGEWGGEDELLLIQGPLALNWKRRKHGLVPRVENGELSADNPPTAQRAELWAGCGVSVVGAEDTAFVKLHTHGAQDATMAMLLGGGLELMWSALERRYRDRDGCSLHYVTAWEMYEAVRGAAALQKAA